MPQDLRYQGLANPMNTRLESSMKHGCVPVPITGGWSVTQRIGEPHHNNATARAESKERTYTFDV